MMTYAPPFEYLGLSPAEFQFRTLGRTPAARYLAGLRLGRLRHHVHTESTTEGGTAAISCVLCDEPFTAEEWEERHWRDGDGADVHARCCVRCSEDHDVTGQRIS
jgi:hypothetical protein